MTLKQLYQPLNEIFTEEEMKLLTQLCTALAKKEEEWARKANDSERAADEELIRQHMVQAELLRELAQKFEDESTIVEDIKEEWVGESLIGEINTRMSLCKRKRFEMYERLSKKIIDLIY